MSPERLAALRAKVNSPEYLDSAAEFIAEDLISGHSRLDPRESDPGRYARTIERESVCKQGHAKEQFWDHRYNRCRECNRKGWRKWKNEQLALKEPGKNACTEDVGHITEENNSYERVGQ